MRNTKEKCVFLSTSYPASSRDLINTVDILLVTVLADTVDGAVIQARVWIENHAKQLDAEIWL